MPGGFSMNNASSKYWVLVADSGKARIIELRRKPAEFHEVQELVSESQHQPSRELMSDASGRSFHVQGPSSHSKVPRSDAHDRAKHAFSRKLVEKLEQAASMNAFERLAVFADPKTLGRLRQHMSKSLSARVTNELNLDLVGMPLDSLEQRIRTALGWVG
jgi:protein required for attachment to host cells